MGALNLYEPYAGLYVGDYFADTLHLSAGEHSVLRLLLLHTWMNAGSGLDDVTVCSVTRLSAPQWKTFKPVVLPLIEGVTPAIITKLAELRRYDG